MNGDSFDALRRANPRVAPGFAEAVETASRAVGSVIVGRESQPRRRLVGASALMGAAVAVVSVAAFLTIGSPGGGSGIDDATAAARQAAKTTAASAGRSGTAVVRITLNGEPWAGKTVRWNDDDVSVSREFPQRAPRPGSEFVLVDGKLYGLDVDGGWFELGGLDNVDPGSGTTPDEYLAATREDVGGATLRRLGHGIGDLMVSHLDNGSTVFSGTVAAATIARKSGYKEGRKLRLFPFGYVAHDEAADPSAKLDVSLTVGADDLVRSIVVSWGAASAWTYTVTYSELGTTPAIKAPENARSLEDLRSVVGG